MGKLFHIYIYTCLFLCLLTSCDPWYDPPNPNNTLETLRTEGYGRVYSGKLFGKKSNSISREFVDFVKRFVLVENQVWLVCAHFCWCPPCSFCWLKPLFSKPTMDRNGMLMLNFAHVYTCTIHTHTHIYIYIYIFGCAPPVTAK